MKLRQFGLAALAGVGVLAYNVATADTSHAACPAATVADMMGVSAGAYPQQWDLAEFEAAAGCKLEMKGNPASDELNGMIQGNGPLPSMADRVPEEALVVAPYESIGRYGGTLDGLSNATEAGTSDLLSTRHVNLVRFSDDLNTIVPNVAKSWKWNDDFTQLTFHLRKGHKWSDGAPFTGEDVEFWYEGLATDTNVIAKPKDYVLVAGETMTVDVPDPQTVVFNLPSPKPGLLSHFATSYAQGFQPKHFLGQFHPSYNDNADANAKAIGFDSGYEAVIGYYSQTDWTDRPTPLLKMPETVANLPKAVMPSLESYVLIKEDTTSRHYVANPYFFMVDTAGNQLPYISEQDEVFINEDQVRVLKMVNAEIDYKSQSVVLSNAPTLLDGMEKGDYSIQLKPTIAMDVFSFNVTSEDMEKRKVFGDLRFRQAMSLAINRDEINEVAYFGQGVPSQYVPFSPLPEAVDAGLKNHFAEFDPDRAKALLGEVGLSDADGDGFLDLPNGDRLVLNMQFATQGIDGAVVELVGQHWANVGIRTTVKEVTPDEYRSAQSSNKLDVGMWRKGQPIAIVLGNNELFVPPYENYFGHRTGMLWAEYVDTNGEKGVEPPKWALDMIDDINAFQSALPGSDESNALANKLATSMTENMMFIGTVQASAPIFHRNALENMTEFKTQSYEYYRTFPYRPQQWWLSDES